MLKYYDCRMIIYKIELILFSGIFSLYFTAFRFLVFLCEFMLPRLELTNVYASFLYKEISNIAHAKVWMQPQKPEGNTVHGIPNLIN